MIGKIVKLAPVEKGYGFIISKELPCERIYFHWSNLLQDTLRFPKLTKGMWVEFTLSDTSDKGYKAYRIKVVEKPSDQERATASSKDSGTNLTEG